MVETSEYEDFDAFASRARHGNRSCGGAPEAQIYDLNAFVVTMNCQPSAPSSLCGPCPQNQSQPPRPRFIAKYQQMLNKDPRWICRLRRNLQETVLDLYAALKNYCIHLVTFETVIVAIVAATATTLYHVYGKQADGTYYGANIQWTIVTFAIVAPMIMQIRQAFTRREQALDILSEVKALVFNIMLGAARWNWDQCGRNGLPKNFSHNTKGILVQMIRDLEAILSLPTLTRGRHRLTKPGRRIVDKWSSLVTNLQLQLADSMCRMHQQIEIMKLAGFPASEASRINQYHWLLSARIEKLQNIKFYRTPLATRAYTRLFILILPVFYGPYYVYLMNPDTTHSLPFLFAICLSIVTSLTMIGVFNVERAMEDPFTDGLDCIRLEEMMIQLENMLELALGGTSLREIIVNS